MGGDYEDLIKIFKKAKPEVLDEINREAELFLEAQLSTALAADQRALIYASIVGAVLAILIGALATVAASDLNVKSLLICVVPMAACFVVSLVFALFASKPVAFRPPGNNPRQWVGDVAQSLKNSKAEMAGLYCRAIEENNVSMDKAARSLSTAMKWGVAGLIVGVLALLFVLSLPLIT